MLISSIIYCSWLAKKTWKIFSVFIDLEAMQIRIVSNAELNEATFIVRMHLKH